MENVIKSIHKWQVDAGNAEREYDDFLESSFQVEEALEGFPKVGLISLSNTLTDEDDTLYDPNPKELSRGIIHIAQNGYHVDEADKVKIPDVDRLDKACDAIVYAIGSMAKLGLNPHQVTEALSIVNRANTQKLNSPRDEHGKLLKPEGFEGPEAKLQLLLDKIKK